MHHAADYIGVYVSFCFGTIELTQEQVEAPSMVGAVEAGANLKRGVASPGIFW